MCACAGKYLGGAAPAGSRHTLFPNFQPRYHAPRTMAAAARYAALAASKGLRPATLALAWAASRWYMGSVIVGATNLTQLTECLDAVGVALDEATLAAIDEIHLEHRNTNSLD
jgi:aryl-alcohol dehydrogenase-like predicted oxidoreductase